MNIGHRNPLVKTKSFRLVNNIFYNWGLYAAETCVEVQLDVIGNFFKKGPLNATAQPYEVQCVLNTLESDACLPDGSPDGYLTAPVYGWPTGAPYWSGSPSIFMSDNIGPNNPTGAATGQWNMVGEIWMNENQPPRGLLAAKYRRAAPLPDLTNPITAGPEFYKASQLPAKLLPVVGASQRLTADGTWISNRDTTELRLMTEYNNGTGKFPISENDVGGFPVITNGIPYLDSDHDGMPDDWENTHGLNANDPADHNNIGSSGYTRLEEFLNGDAANGLARPLSKPN
jgi:hypothetical protein